MSQDDPRADAPTPADPINLKRRVLGKSVASLLLAAAVGRPAGLKAFMGSGAESGEEAPPPAWGDPSTLVSAIGAGTLAAASVAETVEAYTRGFGYVEHWSGSIPAEMAEIWEAPAMAGRKAAVLGPPDFQRGMIRVVELGNDFQPVSYHETLGWVALEIHVRSPDELVAQLEGLPFTHTGGPGTFKGRDGKPVYRAAQFTGPSGEPLYMTQHMQLDQLISAGRNNVGPLFIQTLAANPYLPTRDFYLQTLGMRMRMEIDTPRTSLVESLGLPEDRLYKMAAVRAPEYCSIQIDEYPESTPVRPAAPGCFSPGVSMCTLTTRDLDAVAVALKGVGIQVAEIESNSIPPYEGSRAIFCKGFGGERVEIVEVPAA